MDSMLTPGGDNRGKPVNGRGRWKIARRDLIRGATGIAALALLHRLLPRWAQAEDGTASPPWLGSDIGMETDDYVPPPWSPLRVTPTANKTRSWRVDVHTVGRTYRFGQTPFLSAITTAGKSILAAPVTARVVANGRPQPWEGVRLEVRKETLARVEVCQEAVSRDVRLSAKTNILYDGTMFIDWELRPRGRLATDVEQIIFEVRLRSEYAKYIYYYPDDSASWSSHRPGDVDHVGGYGLPFTQGFNPVLWLGDEARGLMWFCESDRNWCSQEPASVTEVRREGDEVILRLSVASLAGASGLRLGPGDSLAYTFGLQATPVKTNARDAWDDRIFHLDTTNLAPTPPINEADIDTLKSAGVGTVAVSEFWAEIEGYTSTVRNLPHLRDLVSQCHARGMQVLLYCGFMISELAPEWADFGQQCVAKFGRDNSLHLSGSAWQEPQTYHYVCYRSVWQDFLVYGIDQMMRNYDVDGVYLDSTANLFGGCWNTAHGCGFPADETADANSRFDPAARPNNSSPYVDPASGRAATFQLFPTFETLRRIYNVVKTHKPDGQVNLHRSACLTPAGSFATGYWDGEQLMPSDYSPPTILARLPLDMFRGEFMGRQLGIPAEFLEYQLFGCYPSCSTPSIEGFDASLSVSLLHDVATRPHQIPHAILTSKLWRWADEFDRKGATWLPYWRNSEYATVDPYGAYVSLYSHFGESVVAVVSNLSGEEADVRVKLCLANLGLANPVVAEDIREGPPQQLGAGDEFTVRLKPFGWTLVRVTPVA